jgi:hypothetical protein
VIANCITPYRVNLHKLIVEGIPELRLHTLISHGDADFRFDSNSHFDFDAEWLEELGEEEDVFVLEDHAPVGGLADGLRRALDGRARVTAFGVEGWPACGTPPEALRAHELDGLSLAARIERATSLAPSP